MDAVKGLRLFLDKNKTKATSPIRVEKGAYTKNSLGQSVTSLCQGLGWGGMLYLGRRENHSLALQQRPGPQRDRLCIPGTGSAGASSHRGHRWHTSWHRSSGRESGSDTGSGAQRLRQRGHQLNLNAERNRQNFRVDPSSPARKAEAKRRCTTRLSVLTFSPFGQFDLCPFQAFSSAQHQSQHPPSPFPHQTPSCMSVQHSPHGYLARLSLYFLKYLVFFQFKKIKP